MKSLEQEIAQKRPFDSLEVEAYLNLVRTHEIVGQSVNQFFKQYGLTQALYNVLRIIRGGGQHGVTCSQIGDRMVTRVPDVTRLVDRLVTADLVKRVRNEQDRRIVHLLLTAKGTALLKKMDKPIVKLHQTNFSDLSETELKTLVKLLTKARKKHL